VVLAALLYGGLLLTGQLSRPDHQPHEFIIQGAMALGLVTLFLNAVARHYHEHPDMSPESFDATTHDETTGAASRGYFEAEMDHTAALADRYRQPFSLIVAIIDDFDRISPDRQQELLRDFSWLIIDRLRRADTLCRWQGEKFVAILPHTSLDNARLVADSLRLSIAEARPGGLENVTASIGVCEHRLGEDPMSTLEMAEKAVLRAQREGRNHLVVDGETAAA
jgi:diguanylate cyclase (GGDEF)-like protein